MHETGRAQLHAGSDDPVMWANGFSFGNIKVSWQNHGHKTAVLESSHIISQVQGGVQPRICVNGQ